MVFKAGKTVTFGKNKTKFKGPFDWDGLYKLVCRWIMSRKYLLQEKRYKDKTDNPLGTEVEVELTASRKENFFLRRRIAVSFHLWNYQEKEGILHGKKTRYTEGRVTIDVETKIEFDWQGIFKPSKGKFTETMGKLYMWVKHKEFESTTVDDQEYEALRLQHEIKKFLRMETDTHAY